MNYYNEIKNKLIDKEIFLKIKDYSKERYKIKIGEKYNYIDLFLYNIKFKYYVVIELKITELKKNIQTKFKPI